MKSILRTAAVGVALASLGFASTASAQTSASATARAEILTALSVAVDGTANTLNFGTIAVGNIASAANLTVTPAGARSGPCPTNVLCTGPVAAPTFHIAGVAAQAVNVSFTNATETLTTTGGQTMTVGSFVSSANQVTLNSSGAGSFSVGGTLAVNPGQAAGVYTGSLTVSVAYN